MAALPKTWKVLLSIFLIGISAVSSTDKRSIDPELQRAIDYVIENMYLPASGITNLGLAIASSDGELLYTTGYGFADQEKGIPIGNETQFLVGSLTKSVISTVMVKLLHEKFPELGEAVLDTPIRKLIPHINFTLVDRFRSEQASFRDLVSHRLCLSSLDLQYRAEPFNSSEEIMYRQRYNPVVCPLRSRQEYNNQMYVIAGELLGIIAGKPYTELVQELFTEIGMTNSTFTKADDDFSQMPYRAQPYYVMDDVSHPINPELVKRVVPSNAAGGLYLAVSDFPKYTRFHLNLGKVDGRQVVPEECMRWMRRPSMFLDSLGFKSSPDDIVGSYYAYGLSLTMGSYDGYEALVHGGYFAPYSSFMSMFPGKGWSILTSTNHGPVGVYALVLHEAIFNILNGNVMAPQIFTNSVQRHKLAEAEKKLKKEKALQSLIEQHKGPMAPASTVLGKYGSGAAGDLEVSEKFNPETNTTGLYLSYGKWAKGWLEQVTGDLYQIMYETDIVQDYYALGMREGFDYCTIGNEIVNFVLPTEWGNVVIQKFELGVSLDTLPPVPWSPDSCGPE